ncbi:hypothetical protein GFV16_15420 [Bacillus megaterium]|uniref:Saposin B type region 2 domain-containing protein n=1 Tax=Priestia megaterium TaxID=1404 RepID=A0A2B2Z7R5_PRIMG|nr:hypothetical protein [Priestia megaterium]QTL52042.1 hypothetical protein J5Z55_10960 [Priestia aryabhattai]PFB04187.1 hypothetical protein CN383_08235 [Priestia megaterium]PFR97606.1 hypothetical protein COK39_04565 [Priestia megaterium]RDZ18521.1 hypothetical protein C3744_05875 [Priestia megaterium]
MVDNYIPSIIQLLLNQIS